MKREYLLVTFDFREEDETIALNGELHLRNVRVGVKLTGLAEKGWRVVSFEDITRGGGPLQMQALLERDLEHPCRHPERLEVRPEPLVFHGHPVIAWCTACGCLIDAATDQLLAGPADYRARWRPPL